MMPITDRPALEVADVIRQYGPAFRARYGRALTREQRQALRDLAACRTAALGGHLDRCLDCGHDRPAYNSCRNRHCPKCQAQARARWLDRQAEHLLPVEYYHLVFTLPAELSDLTKANPRVLYDLLFRAAAGAVRDVAADPKRLGAVPGLLLVLHTWGQTLQHHPHVHGVVTGGGLSCDHRGAIDAAPRWVPCRPGFFLPVRVLSRVFRGKYLAGLRQAHARRRLRLPGKLAALANAAAFHAWLAPLRTKDWVVYAKPPFGGPAQVLKYLARYTHRVAISNHRLRSLADGRVTFEYKDYAAAGTAKAMSLDAVEFLRRFVQHVLPAGFVKARHYGLLANRFRDDRLGRCRRLLLVTAATAALAGPAAGEPVRVEPAGERCCPRCGSRRLRCVPLPPGVSPGPGPARDTS
jgi:Putative transposase/Transposase zinc-binding domain